MAFPAASRRDWLPTVSARGQYAVKRLVQTIPLILGVLLLVFLLLEITPGDPARTVAGPRADDARLQEVREDLGLDDALPQRYLTYVGNAASGDLGTSIRQRVPVSEIIAERFPVTLALLGLGTIFAMLISVPLAQFAARGRDRAPDHFVRAFSMATLTMPAFWVGILLLVFVALPTGLFPVSGYGDTFPEHVRSLVLPSLTLAILLTPLIVRSLRTEFIGVRESDYVALARASGVNSRRVALRYELPNAVLPAITIVAVSIGFLLFGIVVVEDTFGLPGLGNAMTSAVDDNDFPVIQGITLVFALVVVLVYLLADILYTLIDPRVELR